MITYVLDILGGCVGVCVLASACVYLFLGGAMLTDTLNFIFSTTQGTVKTTCRKHGVHAFRSVCLSRKSIAAPGAVVNFLLFAQRTSGGLSTAKEVICGRQAKTCCCPKCLCSS